MLLYTYFILIIIFVIIWFTASSDVTIAGESEFSHRLILASTGAYNILIIPLTIVILLLVILFCYFFAFG